MGHIRVHPVPAASTLAWKADTAVIEFDGENRAKRVLLRDGSTQTHSVPARNVRYLTGSDDEPIFKVQAVWPGREEDSVEATDVLFAHDVPYRDEPGRKLHFVEVVHGERRVWVRSCTE